MRLIDVDDFEKWAWRNPDIEVDGENYVSMYAASNFALDHEISPDSLVKRGRWIEHEWAEEHEGRLISNFECSLCHDWKRDVSTYCPSCGALMED